MSRPTPPTYKTGNWPACNEALNRRGSLAIWFGPEMSWKAAPTGRRGRQQTYSDAAVQTCLTMKVLFGTVDMVRHRFEHDVDAADDGARREPGSRLIGLDWSVPDWAGLQHPVAPPENLGREHPVSRLQEPAAFADRQHGHQDRGRRRVARAQAVWRKFHLGIDEQSLQIRGLEGSLANGRRYVDGPKEPVDGTHIGDAPVLPDLLSQIPAADPGGRGDRER